MIRFSRKNLWLLMRASALVAAIIVAKLVLHYNGIELLSMNNLFSGIIAGNVFLMGFLLSGVLADYKESERIPGEIANSISTIFEECTILYDRKRDPNARNGMLVSTSFVDQCTQWFYRKIKTRELLQSTQQLNAILTDLESCTQANHIVRLKNEITSLKRLIVRTDTIRDTSFISSGYLIASSVTSLLCIGLVLSKIEPFTESLFFVGVIAFLMIFLLLLIRDLDDPFAFGDSDSAENVSLHPIDRLRNQSEEDLKSRGIAATPSLEKQETV